MRLITTLSCLILGSHFLSGQTWLYWSNLDNSSIRRGTTDGGPSETVFYDADYVFSMKVDFADQLIIWSGLEYLHRRNFSNTFQADIASNSSGIAVTDIELDTARNKLYYLDITSGILKCNYDGTETVYAYVGQGISAIGIDRINENLYWTVRAGYENPGLYRTGLNGGTRERLVSDQIAVPLRLEVDEINQKIYWYDSEFEEITEAKLDGSERRVVFDHVIALQDMAIDPLANDMYWICGTEEEEYILRGNLLSGGSVDTLYTGANDLDHGRSITIVPEALITGLDKYPVVKINVSPNPSSGQIKISGAQIIRRVEIFNQLGQQIKSKSDHSNGNIVEVNGIPSGVYYLRIKLASGEIVAKEVMVH